MSGYQQVRQERIRKTAEYRLTTEKRFKILWGSIKTFPSKFESLSSGLDGSRVGVGF
jgi:hypothetical protein